MIPTSSPQATASTSRLRLTRRGRLVLGALAVILALTALTLGAMFSASQAQAATDATSHTTFEYIVAGPGDTLWSIAEQIAPNADPRVVIDDVKRLNQIDVSSLDVGQELAIPLQYTTE